MGKRQARTSKATGPVAASRAVRNQQIPARPVLRFCDVRQPEAFTVGAFRMRDLIAAIHAAEPPGEGTLKDEVTLAGQFTDRLIQMFEGDRDARRGAATAIAHWLIISRDGIPDAADWTPLETGPDHVWDGDDLHDRFKPPAGSHFFNLDGEPVSIGPELIALRLVRAGFP